MKRSVRPPAVAGAFYEGEPARLSAAVGRLLAAHSGPRVPSDRWRALLLPHAGHVYSGAIAAAGVASVAWPSTILLLGPNHHGAGAAAALSTYAAWRTPLGDVPASMPLAADLLALCPEIREDEAAHREEHSLEVILPFLQKAAADFSIACVSIGEPDLPLCLAVGDAVAEAVRRSEARGERVAIVVSSDLNHYLPRTQNRIKDDRALTALKGGKPQAFFEAILGRERISMCGVLPATALLRALEVLGAAPARIVAQGDSGDAFGDLSRVVGYAAVLWESAAGAVSPT
ncbi:MAG: AmmeMemoRadiSam system protein B [Thermoanaerobaculia bacterium]